MTKREMSHAVLAAKKSKGLTWAKLAEAVGLGEVWLASCGHGENCLHAGLRREAGRHPGPRSRRAGRAERAAAQGLEHGQAGPHRSA